MKKLLLFPCVCFFINFSFGQLQADLSGQKVKDITDIHGNYLIKDYNPEITGTPFINSDWKLAIITLTKGNMIGPIFIKLNIESNELYYQDKSGKELVAIEGQVRKIDCINFISKEDIRYVFKNGYPGIDNQNEKFFYQVYTEGKVELLAKKLKYIRTDKNAMSGVVTKEFVDAADNLYVFTNNNIQTFHLKKIFVLALLKDKEEAINEYISKNKINFKKIPDLINLFEYYNKL
jgi:hypothetical protein